MGGDIAAYQAFAFCEAAAVLEAQAGSLLAGVVGEFAASVVSKSGFKTGSCRDLLGDDEFDRHWDTTWPENGDRLQRKDERF